MRIAICGILLEKEPNPVSNMHIRQEEQKE